MTEPSPTIRRRDGVIGVAWQAEKLLVIRRSRLVTAPLRYCFPGGGIETGETQPEALRREMREELGLEIEIGPQLWSSSTRYGELHWWRIHPLNLAELTPDPAEVESAHWWTPSEFRAEPDALASNLAFLDAWDRGEFLLS